MYAGTLAPGVTFWDAGEFIAAANGFGIPHPPGTPLYVAAGRVWIVALGWLVGTARAMNLLSALCTAIAGALTAFTVARETQATDGGAAWGAAAGALLGGVMYSVWSNATETEVYAVALLHVVAMMAAASRVDDSPRGARWMLLTAYLIALAPALHLSALVGAPAAVALVARRQDGGWSVDRGVALLGVLVAAAGVGRMSPPILACGYAVLVVGLRLGRGRRPTRERAMALLIPLATTALLIMLLRARHDPAVNQGNPSTVAALVDVVARRQYDVAAIFPRRAPLWLQSANVAQYADWQVAMGWGHGIFTTPLRVIATVVYLALGVMGLRVMRRESARVALALAVLVACGTVGVAAYLNMRAGSSLGWGVLSDATPHEARERDYFFVLGFWGWACLAAWGALGLARRARRPWLAMLVVAIPLMANWGAVDRRSEPEADAPRRFAVALLDGLPRHALLFAGGDNDSYPLWYLQQVEGVRPDVQVVTLPLLPAAWYEAEIARRTGLRWGGRPAPAGVRWLHEATAARIAGAAFDAGRPVVASVALTAHERDLLGSGWTLSGASYVAGAGRSASPGVPRLDSAAARRWVERLPKTGPADDRPDGVTGTMLGLLECPRLALPWAGTAGGRDSLEVSCNFR